MRSHVLVAPPEKRILQFVSQNSLFDLDPPVGTVTITAPAGIQSGDLLVAVINGNQGFTSNWVTPPAGWTAVVNVPQASGRVLYHGYKIASGSEPGSYSWTVTATAGNPRRVQMAMAVYRGGSVVAGTPESGANFTLAAQTANVGDWWIGLGASNVTTSTTTSITKPAGWNDRVDVNSGGAAAWIGDKLISSAGSTGTAALTASGTTPLPYHTGLLYR